MRVLFGAILYWLSCLASGWWFGIAVRSLFDPYDSAFLTILYVGLSYAQGYLAFSLRQSELRYYALRRIVNDQINKRDIWG